MTYHDSLYESYESDPYPSLREVLAPEYREMSPYAIEDLLDNVGLSAEDMEFSLRDVGNFAKSIAPTVLPVAGTVVGTAFGGPVGGMVGGTLGRLAGGAIGGAGRPRGAPHAGRLPSRAAARLPGVGGSPAAATLLQLLNRPELMRALQGMALGSLGSRGVQVASTQVPAGAFANLIGSLANQAAAEHHAVVAGNDTGVPAYLLNPAGELSIDPTVPEERAERLLELLDEAIAGETWESDFVEEEEDYESDEEWDSYEMLEALDA